MSRLGLVLCLTATLIGACALVSVENGLVAGQAVTPLPAVTPAGTTTAASVDPTQNPPTPTATPAGTATAASLDPTPDAPTPTPDLEQMSWLRGTISSPSGRWSVVIATARPLAAHGLMAADQIYEQITAERTEDGHTWTVVARWVGVGLGGSSPEQFFFSPDERFMYFTYEGYPDGCGPAGFFELRRFDLETGQLDDVVPFTWGRLVVSPDARLAAFGRLTWLETATGVTQTVDLGAAIPTDWVGSALAWAPDGQALLVSLNGGCNEAGSAVARVDVATRLATVLLREPVKRLSVQEWSEADHALLVDAHGARYWLDPTTGALTALEAVQP